MSFKGLYIIYVWGKGNFFWEKVFLSPTPPILQKPWRKGFYFFVYFVRWLFSIFGRGDPSPTVKNNKGVLCVFVSSWAKKTSRCDVFVVEPDHREGAKRDLIMKILSFLPRSRMSFHSIRSSRCSDFDYAQDDTAKGKNYRQRTYFG